MIRNALFITFIFAACLARSSAQTFNRINCSIPNVVTPGHAVALTCFPWWNDTDAIKNVAYRAELAPLTPVEALNFLPDRLTPAETARPSVDSASFTVAMDHTVTVFLEPRRPGAYMVRLYRNDTLTSTLQGVVSRFGFISMTDQRETLYAPIDLTTETLDRQPITVVLYSGKRAETVPAASDGTFLVRHAATGPETLEAVGDDGSVSILSRYRGYGDEQPQERVFGQTDRPLYHPGDRVHIRAILRTGAIGDYRVDRRPIVVDVEQSYPTRAIARRTLKPDAFGIISTTVALPADAELGDYAVTTQMRGGDDSMPYETIATFSVQAYKKPEYTLDVSPAHASTVGGDDAVFRAKFAYLSGASAANLKLHYSASTQYDSYRWWGPFSSYLRDAASNSPADDFVSGDVTTDENGNASIRVPTKHTEFEGAVSLNVEARDESGRTVSQSGSTTIVPGTFQIAIEPDQWIIKAKSPATYSVQASTYDGSPQRYQPFHVAVVEEQWIKDRYEDTTRASFDLRTDAGGNARFDYAPPRAGSYRFDVTAKDERGDLIAASQYQWVFDSSWAWMPHIAQPRLIPAKARFAPGEALDATLVLLHPARQAVVTISSDRIVDHRIVEVHGLSGEIRIAAPRDAQLVSMTACVPDETGVTCADTLLTVDSPTKLTVRAIADKQQYRPGERARFHLHVEDVRGKPVRAELSLGVVDDGIYALVPEQRIDPNAAFYDITRVVRGYGGWYRPNANPVYELKTIAKVASRTDNTAYQPTVAENTYSVVQGSESGAPAGESLQRVALRKNFLDTAYWSPDIVTDAHGDAVASFTWPENLTTWRADAVAATVATQFGVQRFDVMVNKPLMTRLEMPRFLRVGDKANITGIVHGPKPGLRVRMQLDPSILASPQPPVSVVLDSAKHASATWPVESRYVGSVDIALRAAGGDDSDGMQLTLPLLGATPLEHDRSAGNVTQAVTVPTDLGPSELAGALRVSFAPSMIAQLAQTVRQFDVYPYYCTEQTSSNGIVAAALLLAGGSRQSLGLANDPKNVIIKARERLANLRHSDNAWGWWNYDESSLFMTAYSLYAQDVMDRATHVTGDVSTRSTASALMSMLEKGTTGQPDAEVALAAYALSRTQPEQLPGDVVKRLLKGMNGEDALTVALTGLTARELGNYGAAETAAQLLIERGETANGATFWHDLDWDWRWWSDPVEATALGALLLHESGHEPEAQRALTFIRAQRNADWWYTTLDTAMASMAIAEIEGSQGAGDPDETARILVDGRVVKSVHITSALPDASDTHVVVPASVMHGARVVSIERSGSGNLYWNSDFEKYASANVTEVHGASNGVLSKLFAKPAAFSVKREYSVGHAGPWRVGDVVNVTLWITSKDGAEYVTLEDPFPAGTEYQLPQGETGNQWSWDGAQFLDDRAAFFIRRLTPGDTTKITYSLRATTVGTFEAPGPSAFASYGPPVETVGTGERVKIVGE